MTRYLPQEHDRATERAFYTIAALVAAQPRGARDQEAEPEAEPDSEEEHDTAESTEPEDATAAPGQSAWAGDERCTLGQTLAWAVENGHLKGDMVRDRLHLLARYRTERLHRELPKLIAHLRADFVPVDWGLLLRDLALWDRQRDQVAKQWVQHYHRTRDQLQRQRSKNDAPQPPETPESETA